MANKKKDAISNEKARLAKKSAKKKGIIDKKALSIAIEKTRPEAKDRKKRTDNILLDYRARKAAKKQSQKSRRK